ncbi:molybdenum cofactor guanylyltransferase [Haloferula sp. BvORR071]|uniref:molybdenum cofactor guanylyltransferase n=1 Tax=Haloferula sp. BvORR071 TaxID=1396141 RepID=UPI0005580AB1|nr:molybdenum cofactor guanylyltransferase [Haloferula sp. BvORR071]
MTALILIAGHSTRMGRDKSLITRPDGLRQIDHLVAITRAAGLDPLLSMRDDGSPPPLELPLIRDRHPGAGPLAALDAFHISRPGVPVLLIGGDHFLLDEATLGVLLDGRDPARAATAFANRLDGQPEPLCAIFEASAIPQASAWLARGEPRARHFLRSLDPKVLDLPHPAALDNVNTPADLDEAFAKLMHGVVPKTVNLEHPHFSGSFDTLACTIGGLFAELSFSLRLAPETSGFQPALDGQPVPWQQPITAGSSVAFLAASSTR